MAETVNLPGLGPVKSTYVWAGGAAIVGIAGYAWWQYSKNQQPADFVGASPDDFGVTDYDSPLGSSGTNSTVNVSQLDPAAIDTNAKWTIDAADKLSDRGYDSATVVAALGKYLQRKGLTEAEILIVQAAIAVSGPPPVGGPYPITNALPNPPSTGEPEPLYANVKESWRVENFLRDINGIHPGLGLTLSKLMSLNPTLTMAYSKTGVGYVPAGTPGAVPTFGYDTTVRIR
jgi:hypothetical protein